MIKFKSIKLLNVYKIISKASIICATALISIAVVVYPSSNNINQVNAIDLAATINKEVTDININHENIDVDKKEGVKEEETIKVEETKPVKEEEVAEVKVQNINATSNVSNQAPVVVPEPVQQPVPEPTPEPVAVPVVEVAREQGLPNNYECQYLSDYENEILTLVNQFRAENGLAALSMNNKLIESARYKSNSMLQLNYFEHTNPQYNNQSPSYLIRTIFNIPCGYCGENLHMSEAESRDVNSTALQIVTDWKESPGHRANMLRAGFTKIGVGVAYGYRNGQCTIISTQHFSN